MYRVDPEKINLNKINLMEILKQESSENLIKKIGLNYQYEIMDVDFLVNMEPMIRKMNDWFIWNLYLD